MGPPERTPLSACYTTALGTLLTYRTKIVSVILNETSTRYSLPFQWILKKTIGQNSKNTPHIQRIYLIITYIKYTYLYRWLQNRQQSGKWITWNQTKVRNSGKSWGHLYSKVDQKNEFSIWASSTVRKAVYASQIIPVFFFDKVSLLHQGHRYFNAWRQAIF